MNFGTGTLGLLVATAIGVVADGPPRPPPTEPGSYLGGPPGGGVHRVDGGSRAHDRGAAARVGLVAGQLAASVLLDVLAPAAGERLTAVTATGTVLTLVAAGIAAWPGRGPVDERNARMVR